MTTVRFDGVVKPMRRGGWSARGITATVAHGQLVETQVGPRAFKAADAASAWLQRAAADRAIEAVRIVVWPPAASA